MTQAKFLKLLKAHIFEKHGTQTAAADHWGTTSNRISLIVNGIRAPTEEMLSDMGVSMTKETKVTFKRNKAAS